MLRVLVNANVYERKEIVEPEHMKNRQRKKAEETGRQHETVEK